MTKFVHYSQGKASGRKRAQSEVPQQTYILIKASSVSIAIAVHMHCMTYEFVSSSVTNIFSFKIYL